MLTTKGMDGRRGNWTIVASSPVFSMVHAALGTTQFLTSDALPVPLNSYRPGRLAWPRPRSAGRRKGVGTLWRAPILSGSQLCHNRPRGQQPFP